MLLFISSAKTSGQMENIRLAPDDETDDLYSGFEVNEDLLNVSFVIILKICFYLSFV